MRSRTSISTSFFVLHVFVLWFRSPASEFFFSHTHFFLSRMAHFIISSTRCLVWKCVWQRALFNQSSVWVWECFRLHSLFRKSQFNRMQRLCSQKKSWNWNLQIYSRFGIVKRSNQDYGIKSDRRIENLYTALNCAAELTRKFVWRPVEIVSASILTQNLKQKLFALDAIRIRAWVLRQNSEQILIPLCE